MEKREETERERRCCVFVSRSPFRRSSCVVRSCGFDRTVSSDFPPVSEGRWPYEGRWASGAEKEFMTSQVRKDELLAKAVVIDGRKEWCCRFCSETNVWTGAKCRRCITDIPSGLHGKHLQAVSARNGVRFVVFR